MIVSQDIGDSTFDRVLVRGKQALRRGDFSSAIQSFRECFRISEDINDCAVSLYLSSVSAMQLGKDGLEESLQSIEQALLVCNTKSEYFVHYGLVLFKFGRIADSVKMFTRATVLSPNFAEAHERLGIACFVLGHMERAERSLQRVLALDPNRTETLWHLAIILERDHRYLQSLELLQRMQKVDSSNIHVLEKMTSVYEKLFDFERAIFCAKRAEAVAPNKAVIQHDLGRLYGEAGEIGMARHHFCRASKLLDGRSEWRWKHLAFCPHVFEDEKQIEAYWRQLEKDLQEAVSERPVYDWKTLVRHGFTWPFELPHLNHGCRWIRELFVKLFVPSFHEFFEKPPPTNRTRGEKIRVGFLVTPGHEGGFIRRTAGIIERLNRERFEPIWICHRSSEARLQHAFRRFAPLRLVFDSDFESAVHTIRNASCDLIYHWKVGADPWSLFLPMCRLSPVQCTSWATHGTSGMPCIDHHLSWDRAEPENAQEQYTESLIRFKSPPLYETAPVRQPTASRRELGLPESGAIYFCPHRIQKYHPGFDHYLEEVLARDAMGHVVLLCGNGRLWSERLKHRIRSSMDASLASRLIFQPQQSPEDYYRYLSASTVLLNSPYYTGEITTLDSFVYGVPGVACTGNFLVHRYTAAYYEAMGLHELVRESSTDWADCVVHLGTDPEYHRHISQILSQECNQFQDAYNTVREWENFITSAVYQE